MNKKELYKKIDRYFEAELSRSEEELLLRQLLPLQGSDSAVDEALAVMLASRIPVKTPVSKKIPLWRIAAVGTFLIAAAGIGFLAGDYDSSVQGTMLAYVGGVMVDDPHEIMNIIDNQLSDIGESSEFFVRTVSDDLDDIRDALNSEGL